MHKLSRIAAFAAAVAAFAAPGAHAQGPSPDARDAATGWHGGRPHQNLASPDAQDAAKGRGTFSAPEVTIVKVPQSAKASAGGVDWADVGIGAGGVLGVVLLAGGGAALVARRRDITLTAEHPPSEQRPVGPLASR